MNKHILAAAALVAASQGAFAEGPAAPEKTAVGVSLNASILLGLGVSVGTGLGDHFNVRGVYNGYSVSRDFDDDKGRYDGKVRLRSYGVLGDYHPFQGVFRLTAGLLSDGNQVTVVGKATSSGEYDVGDCTYVSSTTDPLHLDGKVDFRNLAPYFGFGWGGNMNAAPGFFGTFDLGVMFAGNGRVALTAGGSAHAKPGSAPSCGSQVTDTPVAGDPNFQAELDKARNEVQDNADKAKLWPSIQFGLGWRF